MRRRLTSSAITSIQVKTGIRNFCKNRRSIETNDSERVTRVGKKKGKRKRKRETIRRARNEFIFRTILHVEYGAFGTGTKE